jgi:hypothetical protein
MTPFRKPAQLILATALLAALALPSPAAAGKVYVSVSLAGAVGGLAWYVSYSTEVSRKTEEIKHALLETYNLYENGQIASAARDDRASSVMIYLPLYHKRF